MDASVHALPDELLIHVFTLYLDQYHLDHRTILALVAKRWHNIVYYTSLFWTRIHRRNSATQNMLALERSGSSGLEVNFQLLLLIPRPLFQAPGFESFKEACKHMYRWRTASLGLNPEGTSAPHFSGTATGVSRYIACILDAW